MHTEVTIVVRGTPAPQGSKHAFRNPHSGKIQQVESSKAVKPWRQDVRTAAIEQFTQVSGRLWAPLQGPLAVSMVFSFNRPKGHWRTGRNAHLLRDSAPNFPHGRPDLSKLARSTEDALTDVVWVDDAQIVRYVALEKVYSYTPSLSEPRVVDSLPHPGAVIRVWSLPPCIATSTTVTEES